MRRWLPRPRFCPEPRTIGFGQVLPGRTKILSLGFWGSGVLGFPRQRLVDPSSQLAQARRYIGGLNDGVADEIVEVTDQHLDELP